MHSYTFVFSKSHFFYLYNPTSCVYVNIDTHFYATHLLLTLVTENTMYLQRNIVRKHNSYYFVDRNIECACINIY